MRVNVRCRNCQARKVLTQHPDKYIRLPKCNNCGEQNYRVVIIRRPKPCLCIGLSYPHRHGSSNQCELNTNKANSFLEDL